MPGTLHVLIAEDEALVAKILRGHVERYAQQHSFKAQVEIFTDGFAALVAAQDRRRNWDLLLLDYRLPKVDGEAIWRALETTRPALLARTLFITQAAEELKMEHEGVPAPILAKPFRYEALQKAFELLLKRRQR